MRQLDKEFIRVPLADVLSPKSGRICYGPTWWYVTTEREVLFFRRRWHSPQANQNEAVLKKYPIEGCTIEYIPMTYLEHECRDYGDQGGGYL